MTANVEERRHGPVLRWGCLETHTGGVWEPTASLNREDHDVTQGQGGPEIMPLPQAKARSFATDFAEYGRKVCDA